MVDERAARLSVAKAMSDFERDGSEYGRLLFAASVLNPNTGSGAIEAQRNRLTAISLPEMPRWFKGIDEILRFIQAFQQAFLDTAELEPIAFLLQRLIDDFRAVVELCLSGLQSAAFDTLRDVIEIEHLLRDFFYNSTHIQEWLHARSRVEKHKFEPVQLRRREAKRQGLLNEEELQANADYRNHSQALHVSANVSMSGMRGINRFDEVHSLFPFYDMFFHGAGIISVLVGYTLHFSSESVEIISHADPSPFLDIWAEPKEEINRMTMEFKARNLETEP